MDIPTVTDKDLKRILEGYRTEGLSNRLVRAWRDLSTTNPDLAKILKRHADASDDNVTKKLRSVLLLYAIFQDYDPPGTELGQTYLDEIFSGIEELQ